MNKYIKQYQVFLYLISVVIILFLSYVLSTVAEYLLGALVGEIVGVLSVFGLWFLFNELRKTFQQPCPLEDAVRYARGLNSSVSVRRTRNLGTVSLGEGCFLYVFNDPMKRDVDERVVRQIKVPASWLAYGKRLSTLLMRDGILWEVVNIDDQPLVHVLFDDETEDE